MALAPKYVIQEYVDSTGFYLIDVTGAYDVTTNPGGYGAPNIAFLTSNIAEIGLKTNDGTVIGILDTEYSFSLFDADRKLAVDASFYSLDTFDDMVIEVIYTVKNSGGTDQGVMDDKVLFDSFTEVNLKNALFKANGCDCGCWGDFATEYDLYRARLTSYRQMVANNVFNEAQTGIALLVVDTANFCFNC